MSREFKFKGLHTHAFEENKHLDGTWVYGYLCGNGHYIETDEGVEKLIDPDTVGQYIGLTDKNKKKIYEGDKVIITDGQIDEEDGVFIVEYDRDTARFVLSGESLECDFDSIDSKRVEVTGNIHKDIYS